VTREVPKNTIAAGVPAKTVIYIDAKEKNSAGQAVDFDDIPEIPG
jgi:acetyltransferase-like isoleucine patch superfamily enzyme